MRIKTVAMAVHVAVQTKQMEQVHMHAMSMSTNTTSKTDVEVVDVQQANSREPTAKERLFFLFDRIRQFIRKH